MARTSKKKPQTKKTSRVAPKRTPARPSTPAAVGKEWAKLLRLLPGFDPFRSPGGSWFDAGKAEAALSFIAECITHVEGGLAGQPFVLEQWQKSYVANLFGWQVEDRQGRIVRRFRESLLYCPRKQGKALDVETPIPVPGGWKKMGDLVAGDEVFDERGKVCRVLEAHPVMHDHPCYRVGFSDGTSIVADAEHLWTVRNRWKEQDVTLNTQLIWEAFAPGRFATPKAEPIKGHSPAGAAPIVHEITGLERVKSVPVRCIRVDSSSSLFRAGPGMVPTHNTPLVSALALYVFFCDDEAGQQNYVAAANREQAGMLFRQMQGMVDQDETLSKSCKVYGGRAEAGQSRSIVRESDLSFTRVISGDAKGKHGGNPHMVIVDELHEQPDRHLIDTLTTSMASLNRKQSLLIYLTTADFDRPSICNEKHEYACKVRDGIVDDPKFLPAIYEAKTGADWTDPKVWAAANPNLGVSVSEEFLRGECEKAKANPSLENTFKRLHLNMKTETDVRWLPNDLWAKGGGPFDASILDGKDCWAGLDFGWRDDYAALVLVFRIEGVFYVLCWFWLPTEGRRDKRAAPTNEFVARGLVKLTPGNSTDMEAIYAALDEANKRHCVKKVALDPANARKQGQDLMAKGYDVVEFTQSKRSYNEPCRFLESLLKDGNLRHGDNLVLKWMAANATAELNGLGEIMPRKVKSAEKIDGIAALCMALSQAMLAPENETASVYDEGGIEWL